MTGEIIICYLNTLVNKMHNLKYIYIHSTKKTRQSKAGRTKTIRSKTKKDKSGQIKTRQTLIWVTFFYFFFTFTFEFSRLLIPVHIIGAGLLLS